MTKVLTELDTEIRQAEQDCLEHYGLSRSEDYLDLDSDLGRQRVRIQTFGTGSSPAHPVLLLHGVGSHQAMAAPLLPFLADRRVIAVDWPGHGLSDACLLPPGVNLRSFAVSLVDSLLSELGEHRVDLVGHSLGAQFGLYAALDLPLNIRRVVCLGAPGAAFAGAKPATMMKVMALPGIGSRLLGRQMSAKDYAKINEQYILGEGALSSVPASMIDVGRLVASRPGNAASVASYFKALIRANWVRSGVAIDLDELGRLTQPCQFVWGDLDVFNTPAAAAASIVAIRDCRLIRVPNAGHAPWLHNLKATGRAVAEQVAL